MASSLMRPTRVFSPGAILPDFVVPPAAAGAPFLLRGGTKPALPLFVCVNFFMASPGVLVSGRRWIAGSA